MFDPKVQEALEALSAGIKDLSPELAELFHAAQEGEIEEADAALRMADLLRANPSMSRQIESLALDAFRVTREADLPAPTPVRPTQDVAEALLFEPNSEGLPRLNPLYEANLAERIQFDGDAPEARFKALPEGAIPAVPVGTTVRDPVALGKMLEEASDQVKEEALHLLKQYQEDIVAMVQGSQQAELVKQEDVAALTHLLEAVPPEFEPEGYKTGQLPAARKIDTPIPLDVAQLPLKEQQEAAFRALSSTQGRRSACSIVQHLLAEGLAAKGFAVSVSHKNPDPMAEVKAYAEWTAQITSAGEVQPRFSYLDVAVRVLELRLVEQLRDLKIQRPVLEVISIDTVNVRKVGWAARIVEA